MKKIFIYVFLLLATLCARISVNAQVVEICAGNGTDSVTLYLDNYQYGLIQWQQSSNGLGWLDVEGANDTVYKFIPANDAFYRAMIFYSGCPYDSSQVSHVMLAPRADAGEDMLVNAGYMTRLRGNEMEGARSLWEVLDGDNASIDDEEDPNALFRGTDSIYQLQWTLANVCGVSHDTVEIRYVEPEFYDAIAVVDTTDQIFGDSLERYLGLYRIVFSDPVPVVTDSTVLVGIPLGGFLRKVLRTEHHADTVIMYTKQATLDDVIEQGSFSFDAVPANRVGRGQDLYSRRDHLPTRAELMQNPRTRDGRVEYYAFPVEYSAIPNTTFHHQNRFPLSFDLPFDDVFNHNFTSDVGVTFSDFQMNFTPICEFDFEKTPYRTMMNFDFGFRIPLSFKCKLDASFAVSSSFDETISAADVQSYGHDIDFLDVGTRYVFIIGAIPVEVSAHYKCKIGFDGSVTVSGSRTYLAEGLLEFSKSITYDSQNPSQTLMDVLNPGLSHSFKFEPMDDLNMNTSIDLDLALSHELKISLYEVLGPYATIKAPRIRYHFCVPMIDLQHNSQYNSSLNIDLPWKIGIKMTVFKKDLFDWNKNGVIPWFERSAPCKVTREQLVYNTPLVPNMIVPLKVKMWKNVGDIGGGDDLYPFQWGNVRFTANHGLLSSSISVVNPEAGYESYEGTAGPLDVDADENGIATAYWKNDGGGVVNVITVEARDCEGEHISGSPIIYVIDDCQENGLELDVVNGQLRPSGGVPPYTYSEDGLIFHNLVQMGIPLAGHTYYVKDANGCVAAVTCPMQTCNLEIACSVTESTACAVVSNGRSPYHFYLDGNYMGTVYVTPYRIFSDLSIGTHQVTVTDGRDCSATQMFVVVDGKNPPVVATNPTFNYASDIYDAVQGVILDEGNCEIIERGIYWSPSANMASATKIISNATTGDYVCHIPNVSAGQVFYACAYAINAKGTGYGDTIAVKMPMQTSCSVSNVNSVSEIGSNGTITKVRDGQNNEYKVVQIGDQCWMRENLRTTILPSTTTDILSQNHNTVSSTSPMAYQYADVQQSTFPGAGLLYNWSAVMNGSASGDCAQGICPEGWHVPSDEEWTQLTNYVTSQSGMQCGQSTSNIGKALSFSMGWSETSNVCAVGCSQVENNRSGFGARPTGYLNAGSSVPVYSDYSQSAYFWTATEEGGSAYGRAIFAADAGVYRYTYGKSNALSVRCVRGAGTSTPDQPTGDFICGTSKVKDHQNNEYNTVQIGQQCWTRENMRCTTSPSTGTTILEASPSSYSYSGKKAYYPNDNASNVATYGLLYNWNAAVDTFNTSYGETSTNTASSNAVDVTFGGHRRGICPTGWHVPSDAEWTQLTTYVKGHNEYVCPGCSGTDGEWMTFCIAKALASTTGWNSDGGTCCVGNTPSTNNATGFSAVPAGDYYGSYINFGDGAYFWSATQYNSSYAYNQDLYYGTANVGRYDNNKFGGFSVRCIRDEVNGSGVIIDAHSCPGTPTVTDHEGNEYATVQIGNQCWTRENMRCTTSPSTGTTILEASPSSYSYTGKKAYYPNGNASNVATYGLLYNWNAAVDTFNTAYGETSTNTEYSNAPSVTFGGNRRGICPTGWHVPSDAEWTQLTDYVSSQSEYQCGGSSENIAKALASTTGWNSYGGTCCVGNTPSTNNATFFSAVPAGYYDGSYADFGYDANFWSATQSDCYSAYDRYLDYSYADVDRIYYDDKYDGLSVRCIRDENTTSEVLPNSCPGTPTVTDMDGNTYNTVQIGDQCWMKENMKTTRYSDGTSIPLGNATSYDVAYRYCPDDNSSNVDLYGYLYNWKAVMRNSSSSSSNPSGVQGICPTGWHVPSDAEWTQLTDYVSSQSEYQCGGSSENIAKALASTTGWNSITYNCVVGNTPGENNATGFSAVPAGYYNGSYSHFGYNANFWSATQYSSYNAYGRYLNYNNASVGRNNHGKNVGFSVRCIRD